MKLAGSLPLLVATVMTASISFGFWPFCIKKTTLDTIWAMAFVQGCGALAAVAAALILQKPITFDPGSVRYVLLAGLLQGIGMIALAMLLDAKGFKAEVVLPLQTAIVPLAQVAAAYFILGKPVERGLIISIVITVLGMYKIASYLRAMDV